MSRRKKDNAFWDSTQLNNRTYKHYYNQLKELAISMFEWKNLPDTVDPRFIEMCLFDKGSCVFFKDEVLGYLGLTVAMNGKWDLYNIPIDRRAYATNGYQKKLTKEDSVIIFNNMLHTNMVGEIELFARRLYECDRTIDVNVKAQKTPVAVVCDENQRLTMMNLYMQYDGNQPFIFGDKNLDLKQMNVLQTGAPYIADKVMETKFQIWNEAMTFLGISNTNITKKERMLSDEVVRNMGGTFASRYNRLQPRKEACEKINAMFGLNIDVEYREDQMLIDDNIMNFNGEGVNKNE